MGVGSPSLSLHFINVIKSTWSLLNGKKKPFFFTFRGIRLGGSFQWLKKNGRTLQSGDSRHTASCRLPPLLPAGRSLLKAQGGHGRSRLPPCFCCSFFPYLSSQKGRKVLLKSSVNKIQTDRVFHSWWKSRNQSLDSSQAGVLRLGDDVEDHGAEAEGGLKQRQKTTYFH